MYFINLNFSIFLFFIINFYYQCIVYVAHETIIIKRNYEEQIKQIKILFDAIRTHSEKQNSTQITRSSMHIGS